MVKIAYSCSIHTFFVINTSFQFSEAREQNASLRGFRFLIYICIANSFKCTSNYSFLLQVQCPYWTNLRHRTFGHTSVYQVVDLIGSFQAECLSLKGG